MRLSNLDGVHGVAAVSLVSATFLGWTVQEWAAVAALFYSLMLIADKFWLFWRRWRGKDDGRE